MGSSRGSSGPAGPPEPVTRIELAASIDDAVRRLSDPDLRPIGGGVAVTLRVRLEGPSRGRFVGVAALPELRAIGVDAVTGELVVGAAVTLAELGASPLVRRRAGPLAAAAAAAASPGIRSIATVAGNLVDLPGGSDLVAAAMALGASFELRSRAGSRRLPLRAAPGTAPPTVAPDELVTALRVPAMGDATWSLQRLQTQGRGDRPAVTVALRLVADEGRVSGLSAAATFLGDRPIDLVEIDPVVRGASVRELGDGDVSERIAGAARAAVDRALGDGLVLADDTRGSGAYRHEMVGVLARRAVAEAALAVRR